MTMKLFGLLILAVFASEINENDTENGPEYGQNSGNSEENPIVVKIEEDEYAKVNKKSKFIGLTYNKNLSKWYVQRRSKNESKNVSNGYYDDEETAAHASDTLARKIMDNGEQKLKLNFPDDYTEVYPEEKSSKYNGVCQNRSKWCAQRWSRNENKVVYNGCYNDEETAAHASDTLARKLMENGEQKFKLNFPDDYTEVYREEKNPTSKYSGVSYNKNNSKWYAQRWSKDQNKVIGHGCYDDEETAAHASDTLARKLMGNRKLKLKLNFPENHTGFYPEKNQNKKRKRTKELNSEHIQNK